MPKVNRGGKLLRLSDGGLRVLAREAVVANVPLGVAALGSLTITVCPTPTRLFEAAYQAIPGPAALLSELSYRANGPMLGGRLIREAGAQESQDPGFRADLINPVHYCTIHDLMTARLIRR